jgi:hypothetical protein
MKDSLGPDAISGKNPRRFAVWLALVISALAGVASPIAQGQAPLYTTTTTFIRTASPVNYGTTVTLTATVNSSSFSIPPTGSVTFFDTTGPAGQTVTTALSVLPAGSARPLTTSGPAQATAGISISTLAAGTHTITASYSGDSKTAASSTAPLPAPQYVLVVNPLVTTTALMGSPATTSYGQLVTLTATVTGRLNASGTVSFKNGGVPITGSPAALAGGVATLVVLLPAGNDAITATYSGDNNNLTSTSGTTTEVVNKVSSTTVLLAGPTPVVFGQTVSMTATVTSPLPLGGTLQFFDGGTVISSQTPNGSGSASFSTSALSVGQHSLSAVYSGDISHINSSAIPVLLNVSQVPTTTTLTVNPNPAKFGQSVTLTATVNNVSATGKATFNDGLATLASATLAGGMAVLNISTLATGTHSIVAVYSGDTNDVTSASAPLSVTINQPPVALVSSQNPSSAGQSVTFTATVTGNAPSGTVTFLDGANTLMDEPLSGGVATYVTSTLATGEHQISVRYNGDANNPSAFSAALLQAVGAVVPQAGYWLNPAESGRGFVIEQQGNDFFMASFLYDVSGRATWYGIGPGSIAGATYTGTLVSFGGGQTLTGAYHAPAVTGSGGGVTISFSSPTLGTLTWPEGTISIQRFDFGPGGAAATQPAGTPQTGFWWAPTESGRGYSIEIQGNLMFLAGYMYDGQGNPVWYASGPMAMSSPMAYTGVWQQYGNGQTLTGTYQAPSVVNAMVGNVTIQFSSTSAGTLTFPDGRQVAIERFPF